MASGKTLQSTVEISGVLSPSLQKAIKSAVDKLEEMSKETLESAGAAEKLAAEIDAQESVLKSLRKGYADYVVAGKDSSEEAEKLQKKIEELSGELGQNKQKLSAAERAAESFGNELEDAGEKAENSSEGYTVLKDVIADFASDAISNAVEAFKELAIEGDKAFAMLEARTGASGKEMEGYKDVIKEVYNNNYGESLGDVSEKLSTVIQMTDDLDNASLAKVTKNAIALDDVFGFDTMESMRAVNSLMDQFGITSDQAFNLLVQGAQSGLNQNDDLLDTINEYSVQFRTAGYTADDMFNMLANGAESGTWSVDKLGDAVKEFNIRASDGTISDSIKENAKALGLTSAQAKQLGTDIEGGSVQAYQKLLEKLYDVDDYSQRYQMGVEMFGTMWEDLGEDAVWALMSTEGAISSTNDAMAQMDTAAYDTLSSKLEGIGRRYKVVGSAVLGTASAATLTAMHWDDIVAKFGQAKAVFGKAGSAIASAIGGISAPVWAIIAAVAVLVLAFTNLWKNNEDFRNKIIGIWEEIKGKFSEFSQGIVDRLNALGFDFSSFGEVVGAIWDGFCNLLAPMFEGAFQQVSNFLSYSLDFITGLFDIFAGIFTGDWDMVWQGVTGIFSSAWEFIVNTFTTWLNTFKGVADVVLGWFGTSWAEVWGSTKDFFVNTWTSIASFFSGIWESIVSFCSTAWTTIKNVVTVGIMLIKSIISAAFQLITLPFRFIWENCKDTIIAAWNAIKAFIQPIVTAIVNFLKQRWENLKNNVLTAFNAIKNIITTVWNAIKGFIEPIVTAIVNFLQQRWENLKNNVSTAFNAVKSIATTVWNAIKTSISNVVTGIKNTVANIFNSIKTNVSNAFNGIKSIASSVWNGIKSAITTPINAARDAVKAAIDKIKSYFNFSWSLPKIKLPHFEIEGKFSINPPSVPKFKVSWYKDGGILTQPTIFGAAGNTLLAGGEAGAEAVVPLKTLWDKLETMIRAVFNSASSAGEPSGGGLTSKAGELLALDNFSLGSLSDGTSIVIYYDFSGFTWSPQFQTGGTGEGEDDLMARLKAHEAEFFDWLEEFIQMREVAQYA